MTQETRILAGNNARAVEKRLRGIQDANRLVMHTFEEKDEKRLVATDKLDELAGNASVLSDPLAREVEKKDVPLTSASLINPPHSVITTLPFDLNGIGQPVSYLFNLSADQPDAPAVVRAMETSRFTDYNNRDKLLYLHRNTIPPALEPYYGQFKIDIDCTSEDGNSGYYIGREGEIKEQALVNAALRDRKHFAGALDAMRNMESEDFRLRWTEIMFAASPAHIAAIAMPVKSQNASYFKTEDDRLSEDTDMLCAALSGLAHLRRGMDLPVVSYGIGPQHKGRISYLAQGEGELRDLALRSLDSIQKNPGFPSEGKLYLPTRVEGLEVAAKELLGVELAKPLAQQGITVPGKVRGA